MRKYSTASKKLQEHFTNHLCFLQQYTAVFLPYYPLYILLSYISFFDWLKELAAFC